MAIIYEGNNIAIVDVSLERATHRDFEIIDELVGKEFWIQRVDERESTERYYLMRDYKAYVQKLEDEAEMNKKLKEEKKELYVLESHVILEAPRLPMLEDKSGKALEDKSETRYSNEF